MASPTKPHRMLHPAAHDATPLGGHDQDVTAPAVDLVRYRLPLGTIPVVALPHGSRRRGDRESPQAKPGPVGAPGGVAKHAAARRRARRMRRFSTPRRRG